MRFHFFFSNHDELRVVPDSDTMSLRIFASCHTKGCDSLSCRKVDTTKPSLVKMEYSGQSAQFG